MAYSYWTSGWLRAKKNKEDLEKTNPTDPVLKADDEQFLQRVTSQEATEAAETSSTVSDNADEKALKNDDTEEGARTDSVSPPQQNESESKNTDSTDAESEKPNESQARNEPESAKHDDGTANDASDTKDKPQQKKSTWSSYVPSMSWRKKADTTSTSPSAKQECEVEQMGDKSEEQKASDPIPGVKISEDVKTEDTKGKADEKSESQYPAGVRVTEGVKLDQQTTEDEKEVSVLLDRLHLSSINNRVFAFSQKSQEVYADFTVVLKDMINGAPTAYQDMDNLLRKHEGYLADQFDSMPPFLQSLIKSLPAKFGTTLGPEIMAAASEKPGNDLKSKLQAASKGPPPAPAGSREAQKRRQVPSVQSLSKERGAITSMLSNIVNFLKTRFPFLLTTTNVVMTLATFILMLVFWYCHKRGRETRLAKAAPGDGAVVTDVSDLEDDEGQGQTEKEEKPGSGEAVAEPVDDEPVEEIDVSTSQHVPAAENETEPVDEKGVKESETATAA